MNKYYLFRKASVIHAIKCANTNDFELAVKSFETLLEFKNRIIKAKDIDELNQIDSDLDAWAAESPVASQNEIKNLM